MRLFDRIRKWWTPSIEPDMEPIAELIKWGIGDYLLEEGFSKKEIERYRHKCWRGLSSTWACRIQYYFGWLDGWIQRRTGWDFDDAMEKINEAIKEGLEIKKQLDS